MDAVTALYVIVPSRDCGEWIERCLDSIATQAYLPSGVVVVDDDSTQAGYSALVAHLCRAHQERTARAWRPVHNTENLCCPANLWYFIPFLGAQPHDVVVIVDGDDYLPPGALGRIAQEYENPDVWLTYGSYTRWPDPTFMPNPALPYPPEVLAERSFRRHAPLYNHLLTFRRHLWDQVNLADLQDDDGAWFRASYDHAVMMPMLEMAAPDHVRFIPEVVYVYNEANVNSEAKTIASENGRVHTIVNARPPRQRAAD